MKRTTIYLAAMMMFTALGSHQAVANCLVQIKTAQTQISWLTNPARTSQDSLPDFGPIWKLDVDGAARLVMQASAAWKAGERETCNLYAIQALKRLGNTNFTQN